MKKQSKKLDQLLGKAKNKLDAQQWPEANALLLKAKSLDEGNYSILFHLAWSNMKQDQTVEAIRLFSCVEKLAWSKGIVLNSVSIAYLEMKQWPLALRALLRALELEPTYIGIYLSLATVYSNLGEHKKSLDVSMKAIQLDVSNVTVHLNMGAALLGLGFIDEARIAFKTCITLYPECLDAHLNLGVTSAQKGNSAQAIEEYKFYLLLAEAQGDKNVNVARYHLGYELLKSGQLKEGWALYEHGFDPAVTAYAARSPARQFNVPRWTGQPIPGQRLLVWAEQGLGDEILFLSCLNDVLATGVEVILECAPRLVKTMTRSFPGATVRAAAFDREKFNQSLIQDFDHHIPMGSLPGFYRNTLQDFKKSLPFIVTDESQRDRFSRRLAGYEGKLKVGICWRSGLLNAERNKEYSVIKDWGVVLSLRNCVFINLQYGDCEAEIVEAEAIYGVSILRWSDLDLKNDLDDVFALIECLDLVITAPTAVNPMAGSLGKATLLIQPDWDWPNLGTDNYPWFPNTRCFVPSSGQIPAKVLPDIAAFLGPISA